ncbi:MAG: chorismate synthase [Actinobacteria bacterium]|nr:chorismate synthase [Actinomycetota bacterium]
MRYLDAGESHGKAVVVIVEGMPHGLVIGASRIEEELARRRLGYGRGGRMRLERDRVEILSGVRGGKTMGSPVAMLVENAEYERWREVMAVEGDIAVEPLTAIRPGHADLPGALKYATRDLRDVLERASARETVGRVCAGALAKALLEKLGMRILSHVLSVGGIWAETGGARSPEELEGADGDPLRCLDPRASGKMVKKIEEAEKNGDSLGGVFEVVAFGVPPGIGSHVHWDRRLDARLAAAVMGIQAVKGVEIGDGFRLAEMPGSRAVDVLEYTGDAGFVRASNHAGGIEGGMSNGEPIVLRAAMKPIPTMKKAVDSVDLVSKEKVKAAVERADICAVPAAAVIAESVVSLVIADALLEKTGGDSMLEIEERLEAMWRRIRDF